MSSKHAGQRRSGGGLTFRKVIVLAAAAWVLHSWCRSKPQPAPVAPPAAQPVESGGPADAGTTVSSWPPAAPAGERAALAPDLAMKNYYVVLDGSGSMAEKGCSGGLTKIDAAKEALARFAALVPRGAQLGLLAFDATGISERVPLGLDNRADFVREVRKVQAGNQTPLRSSISQGVARLEETARRQLGYGEYNLVVVTDGEAVPMNTENPTRVVNEVLARSPIAIHTIGFCIGANHSLNQPGRTLYKAAQNPDELKTGLEDVLAESERFDVSGFP